jgi:hypothetical protein
MPFSAVKEEGAVVGLDLGVGEVRTGEVRLLVIRRLDRAAL